MEIRPTDDHTVQIALKTPREIELLQGRRVGTYPELGTINANYYKSNVLGRIASWVGLAFEATGLDEATGKYNKVYYISKESVTKNLAERFEISPTDKRIRTLVFARAFDLRYDGKYDLKPEFRANLRNLHDVQTEERAKAAAAALEREATERAAVTRASEGLYEQRAPEPEEVVTRAPATPEQAAARREKELKESVDMEKGVFNPRTGQFEKRNWFQKLFGLGKKINPEELGKEGVVKTKKEDEDFFG